MKILQITQSLDPSWGGIARVLPMLASTLTEAGDECRIAVLEGGRYGTPQDVPGVEVLRFQARSNARLGRSEEFDRQINDLVRTVDVIHLHGLWSGQNWSAGKAARKAARPLVMTAHNMMMPWAWKRSWWKKRPIGWLFEHKNLRTAACLHALAEGEAEHMRSLGFNRRIEMIANGVHPADFENLPTADALEQRFPETKDRRWVLFLGRIAEQKGIVPGMQACFDTLARGEDWHLIIAGPDEFGLKTMLEAAIRRKGLADRVTFTDLLSHEDVLACLGRSSLLLQPSLSEGLSMSILEAMAAGLPVLISDACNMPEVREHDAGRVVEPNRHSIARALRELIGMSDDDRKAMGRRGRDLIESNFDWSVLIPKYRRMYEGVQQKASL
ncbi:MAG: glycosyltransferase [Phycisphaerales bacterium]|nr:glycosyltransferase [Phycisphaerales bacterium]